MGYSYLAAGSSPQARLQSVTGGPGSGITFGYANNASLLESVNYTSSGSTWIGRSLQYDFLNRLKQISTGYGDAHNYEFDALNRRKKDTLEDGSRWEYAYDQLGQLTNAVKFDAGSVTNLNRSFSYQADGIGNVLTAQSSAVGGGETFSYSYNKQNQLTSVPHSATTPVIGMVNSNATLTVQAAVAYAQTKVRQGEDFRVRLSTGTTNVDRYVTFTNLAVLNNGTNADIITSNVLVRFIPANTNESLAYDADGNLTADGRWTYTWDALNRLTGMESLSTAPEASKRKYVFTYDAGGRRIQRDDYTWNPSTSNYQLSTRTRFVYNGWDMVAELDGANTVVRSYGWLGKSGGLLWVKDHASGEFHVPSFDGNRNVTKLIKYSDRTVSAEYEYAPFGTLLRATGPMAGANPFRFSSEYHDDGTGLVYYGYRYYSPETHRWLSKDPIGYAGGLNLYGFVGNDPVNGRDLFGFGTEGMYDRWCEPGKNPFDKPEFKEALDKAAETLEDGWNFGAGAVKGFAEGLSGANGDRPANEAEYYGRLFGRNFEEGLSVTLMISGGADMGTGGAVMGGSLLAEGPSGGLSTIPLAAGAGLFAEGALKAGLGYLGYQNNNQLDPLEHPEPRPSSGTGSPSPNPCPHKTGTGKAPPEGAEPNSKYTQVHPDMPDKAIQTTIYDENGKAIGQVDWKHQHGQSPGHGHGLTTPGDFGSGHGGNGTSYPPGSLPPGWGDLPPGVVPIQN